MELAQVYGNHAAVLRQLGRVDEARKVEDKLMRLQTRGLPRS